MADKSRPPGVKSSTWAFFLEARKTKDYSYWDFLHGYIYARWPYLYIGIGLGEHRIAKTLAPTYRSLSSSIKYFTEKSSNGRQDENRKSFAETYHGKVLPINSATKLVSIKKEIQIGDLEEVIPYDKARDLIINNPDHIVALDCPCRSSRENPCLPLDVCLIVGEPFASFISEHHPDKSRQIDQDEAVEILEAEDDRGHVHHAFFKDAMLGRFYAICNCCSCCCGAMQSQNNGNLMLASSGYIAQVDPDLCAGCGSCIEYCQFYALDIDNGYLSIDNASCMGCGICVNHCDNQALTLLLDPGKGIPLEISKLIEECI